MNMSVKTVTVFCGSREGNDSKWSAIAESCGRELAQRNLALVYGGGRNGLMGAVARGAIAQGGQTTGVIPESLLSIEPAMDGLTELLVVDSMHTRKSIMSERADAFLVLPGGIGTFEEFFETWTWHQIGLHTKPVVLLNAFDYYTPLLGFLEHAVGLGFLKPGHHRHVRVATKVDEAFDLITSAKA
jgi:uncharacterized protein (TIGR00730 family)